MPGAFELLGIELRVLVPVEMPGRGRVEFEDLDAVGYVVERGVSREDDEVVFKLAGGEVFVAEVEEAVILFLDVDEAVIRKGLAGGASSAGMGGTAPSVGLRSDGIRVALPECAPCSELEQSLSRHCVCVRGVEGEVVLSSSLNPSTSTTARLQPGRRVEWNPATRLLHSHTQATLPSRDGVSRLLRSRHGPSTFEPTNPDSPH